MGKSRTQGSNAAAEAALDAPLLGDAAASAAPEPGACAPVLAVRDLEANGAPDSPLVPSPRSSGATNTVLKSVANLSKTILGSGIVSLPLAFFQVGWVTGSIFFVVVGILTSISIYAIIKASDVSGQKSFGLVVGKLFGKQWTLAAHIALFLDMASTCIVYLLVMGHVSLGLIETLTGITEEDWFPPGTAMHLPLPPLDTALSIPIPPMDVVVNLVIIVIFILPTVAVRRLDNIAGVSAIGVFSVLLFAGALMVLGIASVVHGVAFAIPAWPQWDKFGHDQFTIALGVTAVLPVLLNANFCQVSVNPVHEFLVPRTVGSMMWVTAASLTFCNALFFVIVISSSLAFGGALDGDVLKNFTVESMTPLVGRATASVLSIAVLPGYFASMLGSFVMMFWPLRQAVSEMIWGGIPDGSLPYTAVTLVLVVLVFVGSLFLTNVYKLFMIIGATTCTIIGYFYPGSMLLHSSIMPKHGRGRCLQISAALLLFAFGLILTIAGLFTAIFSDEGEEGEVPNRLALHRLVMPLAAAF